MIYIKDNFLDKATLNSLENSDEVFKEHKTPGKSFWVKHPSKDFIDMVCDKISIIENSKIENVLAFFRESKQDQDGDWRIHNDSIINDQQPDRAIVLYVSEEELFSETLNGTAFWSHNKHGDVYAGGSHGQFNELLINDSNDISKWDLKTLIGHKKNRLISYPCSYFHSKYPNKFKNSRQVFVMFYKAIKNE